MVPIIPLLACLTLASVRADESCAVQLAVTQTPRCTNWCAAHFYERFGTRLQPGQFCTGRTSSTGSGRCLPAWFETDDEATRFFATNSPQLLGLEKLDFDTLYSFGSGKDGSGFQRAKVQAKMASDRGLKPYIDALVLPDQDGAYRLKAQAEDMGRSRNVFWKQYYQFMIMNTNYMVMLIDKFWLASPNCHEELLWVKDYFKTSNPKILVVAFVGKDEQGRSIYDRSQSELDAFLWRIGRQKVTNNMLRGFLAAKMAPTPRDVHQLLLCQFEPGGKRTAKDTVSLYFKNPSIGANGDIPDMATIRPLLLEAENAAAGRRGSFLKEIQAAHASPEGKRLDFKRRKMLVAAAAGAAGLQFAWNAVEEWWNRPAEPEWYEEPKPGAVALVSSAEIRPAARTPAAPAKGGRKKQLRSGSE